MRNNARRSRRALRLFITTSGLGLLVTPQSLIVAAAADVVVAVVVVFAAQAVHKTADVPSGCRSADSHRTTDRHTQRRTRMFGAQAASVCMAR